MAQSGVEIKDFPFSRHKRFGSLNEHYAQVLGKTWLPANQTNIKIKVINDLPFMTTPDGTIVCIPKLPETGVISTIGLSGNGKTLVSGFLLDNIFWNWQDYIAVLNDSQEETFSWSEPCDYPSFINRSRKVYQTPMPLPMIYLYPHSNDFEINEELVKDKNYVVISLPFEEVMNNIEKYMPDLGNSTKYLIEKKEELLSVTSEEELFEVIKSIDTGTKGLAESKHKIEVLFKNLIEEGILNISNPSAPAELKIAREDKDIYTGNPFTAIMKAECIPAFITSDLYIQKYKDAVFSYYINLLFEESLSGSMKGKRTWLYFDELTRVVHADPRYTSPETEKALMNIASRGRNNGISIIYATQRYNEIPKGIRSQTKYAIVFRHKSDEETKMLKNDFAFDKSTQKEILKLRKFEAIAMTTEHFVCYKEDKQWEETGPIKGIILPSLHKNRFLR